MLACGCGCAGECSKYEDSNVLFERGSFQEAEDRPETLKSYGWSYARRSLRILAKSQMSLPALFNNRRSIFVLTWPTARKLSCAALN
jgi:hypothetical protein